MWWVRRWMLCNGDWKPMRPLVTVTCFIGSNRAALLDLVVSSVPSACQSGSRLQRRGGGDMTHTTQKAGTPQHPHILHIGLGYSTSSPSTTYPPCPCVRFRSGPHTFWDISQHPEGLHDTILTIETRGTGLIHYVPSKSTQIHEAYTNRRETPRLLSVRARPTCELLD